MVNEIEIAQGSDFILDVTAVDENEVAFDLTGSTMTMEVKKRHQDSTALFTKSNGTGVTFTDAVNGIAEIQIDPADTSGLDPGDFEYDIWLESGAIGKQQVVEVAQFKVRARVTVI